MARWRSVPRVSVVIATYNWSSVLPFSIGSALRQTFTDFEVLVVGDGCTDDSAQVVAAIGDPRVRWINLPSNSGHQSAPNNEGLRQARGEIVAYLGHDDLWLPHHLAACVAALDGGADLAHGLVVGVWPDGRLVPSIPRPRYGSFSPPSGMTHRRRVTEEMGGWRDYRELNTEPETELWRRVQAGGYTFTFVPRLSAIKFPASLRRDVYRRRPSDEQAAWLARIESEPDLEPLLLARLLVDDPRPSGVSYSEILRYFAGETLARVRRRLTGRRTIDHVRRFKGL
jgi:glycosyltransferase involved in cell wall biosynthesis